ncbi:MAG: hypothetical protein F6K00_29705 [Leptolyngbya sp. SIOISBB]|nr:hypothetical protein [Leptolyngbya sp. SIOISBB]
MGETAPGHLLQAAIAPPLPTPIPATVILTIGHPSFLLGMVSRPRRSLRHHGARRFWVLGSEQRSRSP